MLGPPLCPAGHLPLKGGDRQIVRRRKSYDVGDWRSPMRKLISPLEGEMAGRPERGAWAQASTSSGK
ncbi:lytic murein transglycosylase [Mesorhizobium sp. M4B.F.Ca.ET.143.01.1.1]|nr:lytic murein transglycosylase [Mesorhizobium sp. M4B.F.Ca.ET.049.02.1.2]TGV25809.1 lytic murein transglycosylase [Mesorhizobium sp. M4B.F.Ca.ET.143.01.1.1]